MLPRSFSPPASMPAVENFKTPKAASIKTRSIVRDRGSGQSIHSAESLSTVRHNASNPEASSSATLARLSLDPTRDVTVRDSSRHSNSSDQMMSRARPLGHETLPRQSPYDACLNFAPIPPDTQSNAGWRQSGDIPHSTDFKPRPNVVGYSGRDASETSATSPGFSSHGRGPEFAHALLTDIDKLQQYSSGQRYLPGYSSTPHCGPARSTTDVVHGNMQQQGTHLAVMGGYMTTQTNRLSSDWDHHMPPEQTCRYSAPHDLTTWLQQHRQQLRHQQQITENFAQGRLLSHFSSTGNLLQDDSTKVEIVKREADEIIRAKDNIIEKQKAKILQLESAAASRGRSYGQSNERTMEEKLGATEYEMRELRRSLESRLRTKDDELESLNRKLKERAESVSGWESKCSSLASEVESLKKQVASQEKYIHDLPTGQEHSENLQTIKSLREDNSRYQDAAVQLDKKLKESSVGLQSRDSLIQILEDSNKDLKAKIRELEASNQELLEKLASDVDRQMLQQLQRDKIRLKGELEKARKIAESLNKQLQQQTLRHKTEMAELSERTDQEATSVTALQQQIEAKEQLLKNYKQTVKEVTAENQNLTEINMNLGDELGKLKERNTVEELKLQQQLMKELTMSSGDLQSLVKVCLERANGQELNLSALLGIRDSAAYDLTESLTQPTSAVSLNSLKFQLSKARDIRHEIDKLREIVTDKFAEDMGRRLTCNPQ